ncbi:Na(+)-translocating NADH-quinone reductase subunit C [Nitrincola sp. MINF-07-Sa-05]|uniref:Na(+)-translocating NADH-quinone reductase subunit C n=1 Tax=Nitrincola salilacus TaxID=3400273 RepID=UPI003917B7F8
MSSNNDTIQKTIIVSLLLCVICSVLVSTAAVMLKPLQLANIEQDMKSNILSAAGLSDPNRTVNELFEQITVRIIDLETGLYTDEVNADTYDFRKAARDPALSENLGRRDDIASIKRKPRFMPVYLQHDADGNIEKLILPVYAYGLWSTMYGFLALEGDLNTVAGIGFYEHAETPGLGGEIDNPSWQATWPGKKVYPGDEAEQPALGVIKGSVDTGSPRAQHQIDGLAGATLTSNGVSNMIKFWLGDAGYARFIANLHAGEV